MHPLIRLQDCGQSVWLDYIRRDILVGGELKRMVDEDGLRGLTSNPTIFEKAIAGGRDYDGAIRRILRTSRAGDTAAIFEELSTEDIRMAADVLRPVHDETGRADGYASIEVLPRLAHDTAGTIAQAHTLWRVVNRPNVMIKVPATREGIPAIEALIADGINVNVTLIFSKKVYEEVARAYIRGLERCKTPRQVASVASIFVSRIDTAVDRALDAIGTPEAKALRGKIAVDSSKLIYRAYQEIFGGPEFAAQRQHGCRPQRVLWASTGTKNPEYSDTLYVHELIAPDTVNTMPPATMAAFRDHGEARCSAALKGLEESEERLARLAGLGVDLDAILETLQREGEDAFIASQDSLFETLAQKVEGIRGGRAARQILNLAGAEAKLEERVRSWRGLEFPKRLWTRDATLWFPQPRAEITDRLGWLALPESMFEQIAAIDSLVREARREEIRHVVLCGMGGSSLAPEVLQRMRPASAEGPELIVLDSTHPSAVLEVERRAPVGDSLYVISSKSGSTVETLSALRYFWLKAVAIERHPERRFVAITDPGSSLEKLARERRFRRVFLAPPDVGGRFAALTVFGLVPTALIGWDVGALLAEAWSMAEANGPGVEAAEAPALALGAALGELALRGRDKLTFLGDAVTSPFGDWVEQLIAESTGKDGKGIVPIVGEPLGDASRYGGDRVFVRMRSWQEDAEASRLAEKLAALGHPVLEVEMKGPLALGQEFFRWEMATAAAGAVLGIHPFDQPDVELAKKLARQSMQEARAGAGGSPDAEGTVRATDGKGLADAARRWLDAARPGDYVAIQAYTPPAGVERSLQEMRRKLRDASMLATTLGFGPRFLHSTGQLHKGGADNGLFLQLVDDPSEDVAIPESEFTFKELVRAQALGDFQALRQKGRRVLRVDLGADSGRGIAAVAEAIVHALSELRI